MVHYPRISHPGDYNRCNILLWLAYDQVLQDKVRAMMLNTEEKDCGGDISTVANNVRYNGKRMVIGARCYCTFRSLTVCYCFLTPMFRGLGCDCDRVHPEAATDH